MTNAEMRFEQGRRNADLDWKDGAVNALALQDWGAFGEGYRSRRRELRRRSQPEGQPEVAQEGA